MHTSVLVRGQVVNTKVFASGKILIEIEQGANPLAKPIPVVYEPLLLPEAEANRLVGANVEIGCVVDVVRGEVGGRWQTSTTLVPVAAPTRVKAATT